MNPPVGVKLCLVPRWGVELAGGWVGGKVGPILTSLSHTVLPLTVKFHTQPYHRSVRKLFYTLQ